MSHDTYTVLILDDEPHIGTVLTQLFELEGIAAKATTQPQEILKSLDRNWMGVVITDVNMPGMDGINVMQQIKQQDADIPVILITGFGDIAMAVSAVKQGAYDFLEKPFNNEHILDIVQRALEKRALTLENRKLKQELQSQSLPGPRILGNSPGIRQMRHVIHQVLDTPADILVHGDIFETEATL